MFPADDAFGDFESGFGKSTTMQGPPSASAAKPSSNSWEAMMKSIDSPHHEAEAMPEAPEPPRPSMMRVETTEHDDPILKHLVSMGYPRPLALNALERFDYDIDKVRGHLGKPSNYD